MRLAHLGGAYRLEVQLDGMSNAIAPIEVGTNLHLASRVGSGDDIAPTANEAGEPLTEFLRRSGPEQAVDACCPAAETLWIRVDDSIAGSGENQAGRFGQALGVPEVTRMMEYHSSRVGVERGQLSPGYELGNHLGDIGRARGDLRSLANNFAVALEVSAAPSRGRYYSIEPIEGTDVDGRQSTPFFDTSIMND
jgi:hypothetical protein